MSNKTTRKAFIKQGSMAVAAMMIPLHVLANTVNMAENNLYDVIIVGGSYAGLSAAMSLGRSLRKVLVIDSGKPCNRQTPHSHNFITHDGHTPQEIAAQAKAQVEKYSTVTFYSGLATKGVKTGNGFEIQAEAGDKFEAKKLVFATGMKDIMPDIKGFAECWGISVVHCPYCHGYEIRDKNTGIIANGDAAYHYTQLVANLTKQVTVFTNGESTFTEEQAAGLAKHNIAIVEKAIDSIVHDNGQIKHVVFKDGSTHALDALYNRPDMVQHCDIPAQLGCEMTEHGFIMTDNMQKTTVPGVFTCGDNATQMRAVAAAVASGNLAGAMVNHELVHEAF